jgi:transposase
MKKGRAGTMTHDYKRNGTTTLFAALSMLDGKVIGACLPRHRHREFLRFLRLIDQETEADLDLHLILDNYATHKTPAVKRWLKAHPRFHLHFTPTSSSWLNMVERFFAEITRNRIRRGVFKSVAELKAAITDYLEKHNADPKPFVWTKSAGEILEKVARAKQALESQHSDVPSQALRPWVVDAVPFGAAAGRVVDRAVAEARPEDVGDQALMRGLDTACPFVRPGLPRSRCGRRSRGSAT